MSLKIVFISENDIIVFGEIKLSYTCEIIV